MKHSKGVVGVPNGKILFYLVPLHWYKNIAFTPDNCAATLEIVLKASEFQKQSLCLIISCSLQSS